MQLMKSSATAQQDSSGPYSVWCRNCCEGHRQIISCHYCAPGKGVKRSTKASGGGWIQPQSKAEFHRNQPEPDLNPPADDGRLSSSFRMLWVKPLSGHYTAVLGSVIEPATSRQVEFNKPSFGRDGDASPKTVVFWRESCSSLLSPDLQ